MQYVRISLVYLVFGVCVLGMAGTVHGYGVREAEESLRDHRYQEVLGQLRPASLSAADDRAYAAYLLGVAAFHAEEYEQAIGHFESVLKKHPQSRWVAKAAYRKADCLMQQKEYARAEAIYAQGMQGLLTGERRSELAGLYISYADTFYQPEKKNTPPDFAKARTLYQRALEILRDGVMWERATYQVAMTHFKQEQWKQAQEVFGRLAGYYSDPPADASAIVGNATSEAIPNPYPDGGYLEPAMLHRGEALFKMGQQNDARRVWKKLVSKFFKEGDPPRRTDEPQSPTMRKGEASTEPQGRTDSAHQEIRPPKGASILNKKNIVADAAYRIGKTYGMPQPGNEKQLSLGIRYLNQYIERFPTHGHVADAAFDIAKGYQHRGHYGKAIEAYRQGIEKYKGSAKPGRIASAEFAIAECLARQQKFEEAIGAYRDFLANHPVDENWSRAQQAIVSTKYQKVQSTQREAETALRRWRQEMNGDAEAIASAAIPTPVVELFKQARQAWEAFQAEFPLDARIPSIQLRLGKNERLLRDVEEAIAIWKDLASRYPKHNEASEAKFLIAEVAEKEKDDPEAALELYKEVDFGPYRDNAQRRIRALQEIHLALKTERAFHSNEEPKVHLAVRNIETLTCKLYPLDLQTYFQSRHHIRHIEDLDINLIAAEEVWQVTPENYREYDLIEQELAIPVDKPGAWVVQVKSEELEATTLLLVSDLAIAIKGGKNELFVYAENQRTERAVSNTAIFVSDGQSIIEQGETNRDGVFHVKDLDAKDCRVLSVFASYRGHYTGDELNIQNTQAASPLQPRVVVYTDRSGYRAGETVHYRAMIREIEDGQYSIPSDVKYQVTATDARGMAIHERSAGLSDFGTLHGEFPINSAMPHGSYRIHVSRKDGPAGSCGFEVKEFTVPVVRAMVETEEKTVFYGDPIEGTITVSDFSGNPLAGEMVQYRLAGPVSGEMHEESTDEEGKISFTFETWDLPEEGAVRIQANVPARQIQANATVLLVNTGFTITLDTTRDTYLADEPFQVRVNAYSRDEKRERVAKPLTIHLQKRNREGAYETVGQKTVETSANEKDVASIPFTASEGGTYRIAAEGEDQRGTNVTAYKPLHISGEDDANKLLILNDRSRYQQGKTATFIVVSRLPENLCVITGEREGIVEYRMITLEKGKNTVSWELDEQYSPMAKVSLMVMDEGEFYHRDVVFNVHRGLDVKISADAETYKPRDTAELIIETRDHTGKAVQAEFSLGLVDRALLALYPDRLTNLAPYFEQASHGRFIETHSSAGFHYQGETRRIDDELRRITVEGEEYLADDEISEGLRRGLAVRKSKEVAKKLRETRAREEVQAEVMLDSLAPQSAARTKDEKTDLYLGSRLQRMDAPSQPSPGKRYGGYAASPKQEANFAAGLAGGDAHVFFAMDEVAVGPSASAKAAIREDFPLTAYFNGSIITDEEGRATINIDLPDSLTTWEATARAITKDTLVDQAKKDIVVDKPYRVELEVPPFLTEGDTSAGIALVRNNTARKRTAHSTLIQQTGTKKDTTVWDETIPSSGMHKKVVSLAAETVGDSTLTLQSQAGDEQDAYQTTIPVKPWGIPVRAGKSGIAEQSVVETFSLPSQTDYSRVRMWITLGGASDISLLAPVWQQPIIPYCNRSQLEKGLAALAALDCMETLNKTNFVPMNSLREQIQAAVRQAIATQNEAGLWPWGGKGNRNKQGDYFTTARAAELLKMAQNHGFTVPERILEKTANALNEAYNQTADDGEKCRILYALSCIHNPDFSFVNRIHRGISRLDGFETALLGLTWSNMGRQEKAQETLAQLLNRIFVASQDNGLSLNIPEETDRLTARTNPNDVIAAAARLYFQLPASARTQKQTKIFLEQLAPDSHGNRIIMNTSFGLRMQALAAYLMAAGEEDQSFQLTVKVNDNEVMKKNVSKAVFPYQRIEIDPAFIKKNENRVKFTFSGKGQYRYAAVMEGWTKQDVKPQDWLDRQERIIHHFERDYRHGPLVVAHKEIPRGYSVVEGSVRSVQNELKEVQAGDRVEVRLTLTGDKPMDYLAIEDSIPAGFLLEKNSVRGQADHYSLQGNKLRFYVRGPHKHTYIIYQLRARYPGRYRATPALFSPHGAPEQIYATDAQSITVLPEGETPQTEYNPTPDELYHMGMRYAEIGEEEKAKSYLTQLIDTYNLRPKYYLETARQLFLIHLKGDHWAELVRYFEIIKERDTSFEVQFSQIARLAQAYRNIGEYERAVYVYRSLFDGLFTQESALSGTLQEVNRHREALDTMKQLILEYPDIPSVQNAVYTTGSIIYRNVDQWMRDEAFVEAGYTQKTLLAEAVGMINSFLALYPTNPMADEAGYTLINLWLDQKNYDRVADLAASFAKRYPQSVFLDSFDYLQAYALFQMENYDEALELAKQVSTQEYPAPGGGLRQSEEANTAILMAGKILHAAGRLDEALDEYTRVREAFGDAGKSIAYLQEKGLTMDDLTKFKIRKSASLAINHKNLDEIELRIYKVDLMTFYLMERDLENMTGINLAGITPIYKKTFNVKREDRFAWHELDVDLSLSDPGAYLAVAGGNGLMASGMIIRSDLNIEVQEDAQQGMVRINAYFDEPTNYAKGVKIQVRGSGNSHFLSGETDLRGVFTVTGIRGTATVLAQADEQYGFYRGTKSLGQIEQDKRAGQGRQKGVGQQQWGVDALGNNFSRLNQLQERQNERWVQQIDVSNNLKQVQKARSLY